MATSPQIGVRIRPDLLAKIDLFCAVTGMRRGTVLRQVVERWAEVTGDLAKEIEIARRRGDVDGLEAWVDTLLVRLRKNSDQFEIPDDLQ
jgi:hypothetical protein